MRVVLDTNVLISGLIWPRGIPAQVVALARQGRVRSVISPVLLEEFREVLERKIGFQRDFIEAVVETVVEHSEIVSPRRALHVVRSDPDDDRVLECAVEGKADAVVTGDRHLLGLRAFRSISILSPRDFLSRFAPLL